MTPAVCRASAGAVEHLPIAVVTNLARYLSEVKGAASSGSTPPRATRETTMWQTDLAGGAALVFGAEGKGLRPLVRRTLRRAVVDPARRAGRVAERQRRRRAPALRGARRQRAWLSRRSTSSTATTSCTPGLRRRAASSSTRSRASSRCRERAASSSSTASATTTTLGPLDGPLRARRRRAARAARRRAPRRRARLPRLLGRGRPRHVRAGGGEARVADVPRELARRRARARQPPSQLARPARRRDARAARAPAPRRSR